MSPHDSSNTSCELHLAGVAADHLMNDSVSVEKQDCKDFGIFRRQPKFDSRNKPCTAGSGLWSGTKCQGKATENCAILISTVATALQRGVAGACR